MLKIRKVNSDAFFFCTSLIQFVPTFNIKSLLVCITDFCNYIVCILGQKDYNSNMNYYRLI